jgi:molybdate transport system ATP-binding protein
VNTSNAGDGVVSPLEFACTLRYPSGFLLDAAFTTHATVTALFGPSGSGKTTILSLIAGLRQPDRGRIRLGRRLLFDPSARVNVAPERRGIGYVFQDHLLFPHLRVRRNLLYGWRRKPAADRSIPVERVVKVLDLEELLERFPHTLSGGQRQRVALARALLCGPELLLLDEPLASVDDDLKERVLDYLERVLHEWQLPTLLVTHNLDEVSRLCQWVVRIEKGRVIGECAINAEKK